MRYENLRNAQLNNTAITLGKFDGIHKGHLQLIKAVVNQKSIGLTSVVINLIKEGEERFILSKEEKAEVLEELGVDVCIDVVMTKEFMSTQAKEFLEKVLTKQLGMKYLAVGHDFCYGKDRKGNTIFLLENQDIYGYKLFVANTQTMESGDEGSILYSMNVKPNGIPKSDFYKNMRENMEKTYWEKISSTSIKDMLISGNVGEASKLLGREYSISGEVVHGNHLGRTLDMPTANIKWPQDKLIVAKGVYLSKICVRGKWYYAITNIGTKPTVKDGQVTNAETNIFDFSEDIYGENVTVTLLKHIRPEIKFNGIDELKERMHKDKRECKRLIRMEKV